MTPTHKLRFVERMEPITETTGRRVRVLQQWYEWDVTYPTQSGEWRDVPLEVEHDRA